MKGSNSVVVYYVSSHGFGHLTRCMAQIEKALEDGAFNCKEKNYNYLLVCGRKQIEFAKKYMLKYKDRIYYKELETDVGLINKPISLEIDRGALERRLREFIGTWEDTVKSEVENSKKYKIIDIVSDISPIGILVAGELNLPVKLMTNFTWYQQYRHLNLSEDIVDSYLKLDKKVDTLYRYPLYLDFSHINPEIKDVGFISRKISKKRVCKIQKKYGRSIFISTGRSAEIGELNIVNFKGTVFTTNGVKVKGNEEDYRVYELPVDIEDTQNYIAASEVVISKAGWGTIAEAVCGDTPMVLLERDGVLEDTHNIKEIKKLKKGISISSEGFNEIDYLELKNEIVKNTERSFI